MVSELELWYTEHRNFGIYFKLIFLTAWSVVRPGHDRRYAIDCSRLKEELGWKRARSFDEGLRATVRWYLANQAWCARVRSGEYRRWLERNYEKR